MDFIVCKLYLILKKEDIHNRKLNNSMRYHMVILDEVPNSRYR